MGKPKEYKIDEVVGTVSKDILDEFKTIDITKQELVTAMGVLGAERHELWKQVYKVHKLPKDCIFAVNNETGELRFRRKTFSALLE